MANTDGEDCTSVARRPAEKMTPCVRLPNGEMRTIPKKGDLRFTARQAHKISLDVAKGLYGAKGQPSKSVDRWQSVFTCNNYGMLYVNEVHCDSTDDVPRRGEYPFLMLDVEGHPEMKDFVHVPPVDVCAKLMPQILEKIHPDDPASHVIDWNAEREDKKKAARDRFDGLNWKPEHCMAWHAKEKRHKPTMPGPAANDWALIPPDVAESLKWALAVPQAAAPAKKVGGKRKDPEQVTIEGLQIVKSDALEDAGYAWLLTLPIDENCTVEKIDGTLRVVQHKKPKVADEEAPAAEETGAE